MDSFLNQKSALDVVSLFLVWEVLPWTWIFVVSLFSKWMCDVVSPVIYSMCFAIKLICCCTLTKT